jgi:hypothetical protein
MGNDLLVTYKGKIIADLGRKHNYSCGGGGFIPKTYEELEEELKTVRKQVLSSIMAFSGSMLNMDFDKENQVELINEMVIEITDSLDWLEEECITAGRIMTLIELGDEFNADIEIIDEYDLEIKQTEEEAAWKRLDEYLEECEEEGIYDAVEHQTSEVDLDFEKDTLVGPEWEEQECDDLHMHNESIEDIGYCRSCRDLQQEHDKYLERQNRQ